MSADAQGAVWGAYDAFFATGTWQGAVAGGVVLGAMSSVEEYNFQN